MDLRNVVVIAAVLFAALPAAAQPASQPAVSTDKLIKEKDRKPHEKEGKCLCSEEDEAFLRERDEKRGLTMSLAAMATAGVGAGTGGRLVEECKGSTCTIKVRVEVATNPDRCEAWLDYCRLCVITQDGKVPPKVIFQLRGKPDFVFAKAKRGVEIAGAANGGKTHFKSAKRKDDRTFEWAAGPDETGPDSSERPYGLLHEAHVIHKSNGLECKPRDPIIVNTAN